MREFEVSSNRSMRLVSLLLLGGWAGTTALIGVFDILNAYRNWHSFHAGSSSSLHFSFLLDGSLFLLWIASWNLILPALVLGVIQTARVHRQPWTPLAYAAVVVTGPILSVAYNNWRNTRDADEMFDRHFLSWGSLGGLGFTAIAGVTMAAAWFLLRDVGTVDEAPAAPTGSTWTAAARSS
ncbi:hypothetical protein [Nocardioides marmorisolisilvae]|uniref:Uncharacterized protein n=1 Tax=Nocardioides marmorisolisilvae TaxID=1542737 RepID=A0A3N0DYZ0_9ACTN|nr:hypothetical protein [Nocardioides marmorisolisilvae]RNL80829.1 hypothetical protein EFL95_00110 [Nocardioides marmorisolisilvae]